MISRLQKLLTIVGICLVVTVASGCSGGGSSGAASAGEALVSIDGDWIGTINSTLAGAGSVVVDIIQDGSSLSGVWAASYTNPANDDAGTLIGTLSDDMFVGSLFGRCDFFVTAIVSDETISGSYTSECGDTGSFTLVRE